MLKKPLSGRTHTGAFRWCNAAFEELEAVRTRTAALSKINRRLTSILESMTDAFYTLDENWCFTYLNHQAEQIWQRSQVDLLGKTIWASFPEAVKTSFDSEYHRAVTDQCSVAFETFYPPFNAWFEVRAYSIAYGLGVSIAKQYVDAHHSKLTVQSAVRIGTTFTVTLPLSVDGTPHAEGDNSCLG